MQNKLLDDIVTKIGKVSQQVRHPPLTGAGSIYVLNWSRIFLTPLSNRPACPFKLLLRPVMTNFASPTLGCGTSFLRTTVSIPTAIKSTLSLLVMPLVAKVSRAKATSQTAIFSSRQTFRFNSSRNLSFFPPKSLRLKSEIHFGCCLIVD